MGVLLNSLLVQFKGRRAINRLSEDNLIETVLEEKKNGEVDQVALAKAQMEAEGNVEKTEALYLKHRIQRIKDVTILPNTSLCRRKGQKRHRW